MLWMGLERASLHFGAERYTIVIKIEGLTAPPHYPVHFLVRALCDVAHCCPQNTKVSDVAQLYRHKSTCLFQPHVVSFQQP